MLRILMPWTDHSEPKPIRSRRYFVAAILRALLLCGPAVIVACAGGRPLPDEPVVIVSDAWMVGLAIVGLATGHLGYNVLGRWKGWVR